MYMTQELYLYVNKACAAMSSDNTIIPIRNIEKKHDWFSEDFLIHRSLPCLKIISRKFINNL